MGISIQYPEGESPLAPLYHKRPRECRPQPTHLVIDPITRVATWEIDHVGPNAWTMDAFHGLTRSVPCSAYLTLAELQRLSAEIAGDVECVCNEWRSEWDGHNTVGRLSERGQDALDRIAYALDPVEVPGSAQVWDAAEWYSGDARADRDADGTPWRVTLGGGNWVVTRASTDAELRAIADALADEAAGEGVVLTSVAEYVYSVRRECVPTPEVPA